jgi:murein DD-endopeptidase MepM/ murein hydrolase activator NlpD
MRNAAASLIILLASVAYGGNPEPEHPTRSAPASGSAETTPDDTPGDSLPQVGGDLAAGQSATTCPKPSPLEYYPVRGRHDNGYQKNPSSDDTSHWTCNQDHSNGDFFTSTECARGKGHYGNDVWAAPGTPIVATVDGTVIQAEFTNYSGNMVGIKDACGWIHLSIHMNNIANGIKAGRPIKAGEVIGSVGKTGTASNGVVHLHYSIYPGENGYCRGVDPWPHLKAVENDVCWVPARCGDKVCGKGMTCTGAKCCREGECSAGCPC